MDNKTIAKRIAETTAPPSVIDAVTALIAENERLTTERDELRAELSENNAKKAANTRKLTCNNCGTVISSPVPSDTVVRAWCECPACIADKPDINNAMYFVTNKPILFYIENGVYQHVARIADDSDMSIVLDGRGIKIFQGTHLECEKFVYGLAGHLGAKNPMAEPLPFTRENASCDDLAPAIESAARLLDEIDG